MNGYLARTTLLSGWLIAGFKVNARKAKLYEKLQVAEHPKCGGAMSDAIGLTVADRLRESP